VYACLINTARELAARGNDDPLVEWRNEAACNRRDFRSDAYGIYSYDDQLYGFFAQVRPSRRGCPRLRRGVHCLLRILDHRRFRQDYDGFPTVLAVTTDNVAEERIAQAMRLAAIGRRPGLPVLLTCKWRIEGQRNPYACLDRSGASPTRHFMTGELGRSARLRRRDICSRLSVGAQSHLGGHNVSHYPSCVPTGGAVAGFFTRCSCLTPRPRLHLANML